MQVMLEVTQSEHERLRECAGNPVTVCCHGEASLQRGRRQLQCFVQIALWAMHAEDSRAVANSLAREQQACQ